MVTGCPWLRHTFICNWRHDASLHDFDWIVARFS